MNLEIHWPKVFHSRNSLAGDLGFYGNGLFMKLIFQKYLQRSVKNSWPNQEAYSKHQLIFDHLIRFWEMGLVRDFLAPPRNT